MVHWYTPFEKVLVRYDKSDFWMATYFSNFDRGNDKEFLDANGLYHFESDILPYEGNENKLGKVTK